MPRSQTLTFQTLSTDIRSRPPRLEDEAMLFELFAESKRAEFTLAGVPRMQAEMLAQMQYRGRMLTYKSTFPDAVDSILCLTDEVEGGTPVGRLLVDRRLHCWRILDIAILAEHRGKGMATSALRECQAQCRAAGARLELEVDAHNSARGLYERLGFRKTSEDILTVRMSWSARD